MKKLSTITVLFLFAFSMAGLCFAAEAQQIVQPDEAVEAQKKDVEARKSELGKAKQEKTAVQKQAIEDKRAELKKDRDEKRAEKEAKRMERKEAREAKQAGAKEKREAKKIEMKKMMEEDKAGMEKKAGALPPVIEKK